MGSARAIDETNDNGGRFAGAIYQEASVDLTYFDNTDRVWTLTRAVAPIPDNTTQAIAFS
ncbi:MAG: hypothetical protein HY896_13050 [Deltaproteobacteria bacterium]|nr:hypothetical protein [Deltaproteobacteria bacterium]